MKPDFEALQPSWGRDVWFLTAPTFGAAMRQTAMTIMPQKWDQRDVAHDMVWGLCSVYSIQMQQKLHSESFVENSLLTHSSCFFFSNL